MSYLQIYDMIQLLNISNGIGWSDGNSGSFSLKLNS